MKKKILSIILSLTMLLGVIPFAGLTVSAVSTVDRSKPWYVDENGNEVDLPEGFTRATDGQTFSYDCMSWLYVEGHVTYNEAFMCGYNVGVVLADGAELEIIGGLDGTGANNGPMRIYGQSKGTGKLKITNSGSDYKNSGNIIVNDCTVEVETTYTGEGSPKVLSGNITVNGGKFIVNATATNADVSTDLTAIDYNSSNYVNNKLTVNGGYVEINVNNSSKGYTHGIWGRTGKNILEINGGRVIINATGKGSTVNGTQSGNVTVNGGNLDITGTYTGTNSAYSGYGAYDNAITVNGGTASFTGKSTGSGRGYGAKPTAVSVSGTGEVTFIGKTQALYSVKNSKVTAPTSLIQTSADGESGWTKWNGTDALAKANFKGIKMTPHPFKYAVSEGKLTATCEEGEDCALGYGKNPLTLNINGGNFDAEELSAWKAAGALTPVVAPTAKTELVYNEQEQTGVEAGTGYTLTGTTKATAAGTYTATATLKDGYIWTDATTADKTIEWKIGSPVTTIAVPTAKTGLVYNGDAQTGVEEGEGYTVTNGSATEIGKYTATATLEDGYCWQDGTFDPVTVEWEILPAPHTHTAGTEYMTDGRAHWLACADENCPLNKADDPVLAYEIAFSSYEGPELKELLDYSEKCGTYSEEKTSMLMGRQGKVNDGVVSKEIGRTIIPLTQTQLDNIGNALVIVGCDDSDDNKPVYAYIDCAYTYFYDGETKIEAAGMKNAQGEDVAAFVILDNDGDDGTVTGYGYYRIYSDSVDGTFIGDILFKAPRTFKAVYDTTGDANTLDFYFDNKDHSDKGTVFENGTDNYLFDGTKEDNTNWGYNDIRDSIKGVVIDKSVIKYKGLTDTSYMFYSMNNADSIVGAEYLDVSNVTEMVFMFYQFGDCSDSLTQAPDISNWNTGNVTAMDFMFHNYGGCVESLNFILNLSGWNLSKVSGCDNVFDSCCQSGTWKVTIPAKTGEQFNDDTHWYVGNGTDCIVPADGRSFTLAD